MPFADVNGVRLFYTDEGQGAYTLLLMHGLSGDSHDWNWVIPRLRTKFRIMACDLRGHGHSSAPERYQLLDFVEDMVALIDQAGCKPVVAVGHSLGGAIAAVMAVEHPSIVQAVVEVDPAYALPDWLVRFWEEGRARWLASRTDPDGPGKLVPVLAASPVTPEFLSTWNHRRAQAMSVDVIWKAYEGLADGPQGIFAASPGADDYLKQRNCPVLSFHSLRGRAGWETPLFQHPASRAIEWEGSGHSLHIERPRELAFLITTWLDGLTNPDINREAGPGATERRGDTG